MFRRVKQTINSVTLTLLHVDYMSVEDKGGGILCLEMARDSILL